MRGHNQLGAGGAHTKLTNIACKSAKPNDKIQKLSEKLLVFFIASQAENEITSILQSLIV
jgi:hypothetical protein